jgi:hypothetical protein
MIRLLLYHYFSLANFIRGPNYPPFPTMTEVISYLHIDTCMIDTRICFRSVRVRVCSELFPNSNKGGIVLKRLQTDNETKRIPPNLHHRPRRTDIPSIPI